MSGSSRDVIWQFLKMGAFGFGGPLALVAQMQRELIQKRSWISQEEFQRVFLLIKSMPGGVAFNTAVYLGRHHAGWKGGVAAAVGLLSPGVVLVLVIAPFMEKMRDGPFDMVMLGLQAAALALVVLALRPLAGPQARDPRFWLLGILGMFLFARELVPEPALIVGGGLGWICWMRRPRGALFAIGGLPLAFAVLWPLSRICFEAGAFVFGSGVAIAPLLERDFVEIMGWVNREQFMEALAVGQVTPGPFLLTATYLGHQVAGITGAFVATISIFAAGFFHMMTWFPSMVSRLSRQKWVTDFTFGAFAMVCGTIVWTVIKLAATWGEHPWPYLLMAGMAMLGWITKWPAWSLILIGGLVGSLVGFSFPTGQ